jgi:hypothetical protein
MSWCPGQGCDPCKKPPPQGTPPWRSLASDGVIDIEFFYQPPPPYVGNPFVWGGHSLTFGPHSLPDPGFWFQPPYIPPGATDLNIYYTITTVTISDQLPVGLPSASVDGTDSASVQAADLAAQWQGYNYAVSQP